MGTKSIPFMEFNDLINKTSADFHLTYETIRYEEEDGEEEIK